MKNHYRLDGTALITAPEIFSYRRQLGLRYPSTIVGAFMLRYLSWADGKTTVYAGTRTLIAATGLDRDTFYSAMRQLKKLGYIVPVGKRPSGTIVYDLRPLLDRMAALAAEAALATVDDDDDAVLREEDAPVTAPAPELAAPATEPVAAPVATDDDNDGDLDAEIAALKARRAELRAEREARDNAAATPQPAPAPVVADGVLTAADLARFAPLARTSDPQAQLIELYADYKRVGGHDRARYDAVVAHLAAHPELSEVGMPADWDRAWRHEVAA